MKEEKEKKEELVICIYDENGPSINEKILEITGITEGTETNRHQ